MQEQFGEIPKLIEYAGYVFPGEARLPSRQKYKSTAKKNAVIEEGRRIRTAMTRERDFKLKDAIPKAQEATAVNSLLQKKQCLAHMLFGDIRDEIRVLSEKKNKTINETLEVTSPQMTSPRKTSP